MLSIVTYSNNLLLLLTIDVHFDDSVGTRLGRIEGLDRSLHIEHMRYQWLDV